MIGLFDSGNSRLHFGVWNGERVTETREINYLNDRTLFSSYIKDMRAEFGLTAAAACTVVAERKRMLFDTLDEVFEGALRTVEKAADVPLGLDYESPETLGVDRVLAAYAAFRTVGGACIVVDAGTAVTVDAVTGDGVFAGGFIFPGRNLLATSLGARTSLPQVKPPDGESTVGGSTIGCIGNALHVGFTAAVAAMVARARAAAGEQASVVVTGGDGEYVGRHLGGDTRLDVPLVLKGLGMAYDSLPPYLSREKRH